MSYVHAAQALCAAPYAQRCAFAAAATLAAAPLARAAHRSLPAGAPRLAAVLPLVSLFIALPFLFDHEAEVLSHVITAAVLGWWANAKLLLLALGRGSLPQSLPLPQYTAALLLPVLLLPPNGAAPAQRVAALLLRCAAKLAALVPICAALAAPPFPLPPLARDALFTLGLYTLIGAIMDGPGALAGAALGLRLAPHFANPLAATTVAEFWGKRWNLTAATLLRQQVYEPIVEGRVCGADVAGIGYAAVANGDKKCAAPAQAVGSARRALAVCATFAASGVLHEAILWAATREAPRGEWFAFFALQGPLVCVEAAVRAALRRSLRRPGSPSSPQLPAAVCIPVTWALILGPASVLFFPPAVRTGLDKRVVASLQAAFSRA